MIPVGAPGHRDTVGPFEHRRRFRLANALAAHGRRYMLELHSGPTEQIIGTTSRFRVLHKEQSAKPLKQPLKKIVCASSG